MNIKIYIIIAASSFGLMIIGSIISHILILKGYISNPEVEKIIFIIYCFLFLVLAFAIVPIFLRTFTILQTKIGNGNLLPIKWIKKNESILTYGIWGFILLGIIIALPAVIKDWFLK